ncbi:uncharacterized protein CLAFUR5_13773 [Fulvia fulva]|uniref:RGS domain-containing protein n=1 Tax=Passalora fulva TaxID=5499 RepID=A0A9Q8PL92_PASFU|nr:uncharacterized protein CLAFUR5_13773 [Fulvia fulva]UJO24454.1 hypothetical protein CLAFUR5_13773 [Fulvia fulva]WPV37152.1 hypothetical protein CLAFUW7_13939 [Fulvia fulva]
MVVRKRASSDFTHSSTSSASTASSLKPPSAFGDEIYSADDEEDAMSADDFAPSRPLSVAIPSVGAHGPHCPRRPNLREILANTSPPPWTLAAFMAYLSNNHCLETLEFTMDAGRYKKHYAKMLSRAQEGAMPPVKDREYVQALWQRLVEAYIQPNGSREVNLPSDVRDPIINLKPGELPPAPEKLDPAVAKIYELMEESVLVPFLNSVYPQTAHPTTTSSCPMGAYDTSDDNIPTTSRTHDDRHSMYGRRSRYGRSSPPPQTAVEPHAYSYSSPSRYRQSAPLPLTAPPQKSRFSVRLTPSTSSPAAPLSASTIDETVATGPDATLSGSGSGGAGMTTDDSGSTSSPTNEGPMTPPMSPPGSDVQSPKRDSGMWKKLGRLSGMKVGKKKSQGALPSAVSSHSTQRSL